LDVEIAIRNGALDVGLFGPESVMSLEQAKEFIDQFKLGLEKLSDN